MRLLNTRGLSRIPNLHSHSKTVKRPTTTYTQQNLAWCMERCTPSLILSQSPTPHTPNPCPSLIFMWCDLIGKHWLYPCFHYSFSCHLEWISTTFTTYICNYCCKFCNFFPYQLLIFEPFENFSSWSLHTTKQMKYLHLVFIFCRPLIWYPNFFLTSTSISIE